MYINPITISVGAVLLGIWLIKVTVSYWAAGKQDPREPELIQPTVPFIGHAIGLFVSREKYYRKLRARRYDLPVYTIDIFGTKQYVVNDPSLAMAVQRQARSFSFNAYGVKMAKPICGLSDSMVDMMDKDLSVPGNTTNFAYHFFRDTHASLGHGQRLDQLVQISTPLLVDSVNALPDGGVASDKTNGSGEGQTDLAAWLRHTIIMASTAAVYGPSNNPFNSPRMRSAYNTLEDNLLLFVLNLPKQLIPQAYKAQQETAKEMIEYLRQGYHRTGSDYIQSRYKLGDQYGASSDDIARLDLGGLLSLNSSASPAAFWVMANIIARPRLLGAIRDELLQKLQSIRASSQADTNKTEDDNIIALDASTLWQASPLLVSTFKETLRCHALGSTVRLVLEDTWVGGSTSETEDGVDDKKSEDAQSYLLKKDGLIIIPSISIHKDPNVWGPTASEFDPTRFLERQRASEINKKSGKEEKSRSGNLRVPKGAFRGFGGGSSLCPGRYWATIQILTILSTTILMYDMHFVDVNQKAQPTSSTSTSTSRSSPASDPSEIEDQVHLIPPPVKSKMTTTIENPAYDVRVQVTRRPEWQDKKCRIIVNPKWQVPDVMRFGE